MSLSIHHKPEAMMDIEAIKKLIGPCDQDVMCFLEGFIFHLSDEEHDDGDSQIAKAFSNPYSAVSSELAQAWAHGYDLALNPSAGTLIQLLLEAISQDKAQLKILEKECEKLRQIIQDQRLAVIAPK